MFGNVIAERNLIILSPELINFFQSWITLPSIKCSENRLGSTVPFCLFDRVLNVISIKDIDDNGCKLKTRDLIFFYKIKCHLTKGSKPFCIYWLQQRHVISDQSCSGNIKKMGSVCIIETFCSSWKARFKLWWGWNAVDWSTYSKF